MSSIRSWSWICVLAAACAGDAPREPVDGPEVVVAAIAPGASPEGEAVLNVHWFPKDGGDSVATLHLDGVPAVWGPATNAGFWEPPPVEGVLIQVGLGEQAPPIVLAVGAHTVELVVDGDVVAGETIDVEALMVYSLTAYGERDAPEQLFFAEAIPGTDGEALPTGERAEATVYNMMPGGGPIYGSFINIHNAGTRDTVFEGLAYGAAWSGTYGFEDYFNVSDAPQPDRFQGGFVWRGFGSVRHYVYYREPVSGDLGATTDGWFMR